MVLTMKGALSLIRLDAGGGRQPSPAPRAPGSIGAQGCSGASTKRGRVLGARAERNRGGRRVAGDGTPVSEREAFDAILASLHETALDRAHWSSATALIDDALGTHGSSMVFGDGDSEEDIRIFFAWSFVRGQRDRALEREYFQTYYPRDERAPRLRRLPDSRLFHITDLYTDEELKTSAAYNELLPRTRACNSINVRLDGPGGSRIVWVVNDPVDGDGWSSARLNLIQRLLPHIRQCVRAQQALAGASALGASLATLLDHTGLGIVQLDGRGRIVAANDRARDVIRTGEGLFDEDGFLHARSAEDDAQLQAVLARALPPFGVQGAAGSTMVSRSSPTTAAGAARQPGGPAGDGLAGVAGRGAGAGRRPGEPDPHRSGRGGGGARAHGDGEPRGGAVGRRHDRPRGRRGDGPRRKHDPLACEAHVRQAWPIASGGPGAAGAFAGRRSGVPALKAEAAADRR